jgi:phosphatidylethanolamine-binding protein (PEBP) family uncharacterized protein
MAQRTGADRLLVRGRSAIKSTGAALAPVLLAFLLTLSGCGGGGGSDGSTRATTSSSTQGGEGKQASSDPSSSQAGKQEPAPGKQGSPNSSTPSPQGKAAKHGAHIAQPKGEREHPPSSSEVANSAVADIALASPDFITTASSEYELPSTYTCDGKNNPPTLKWSGVPAGTKELILFVLGLQPVGETLFFNWAVAGLNPSLTEIPTGRLPTGAILGRNGYGKEAYSICPPQGQGETYVFALYALPQALKPKRGFDPMSLRREVLGLSGDVGLVTAAYGR